jgi:hypothetical protein
MSTKIGSAGITFPDSTVQTTANIMVKAWVNFDGTPTTPSIRASYNVSSVTKNSTGNYTINFTNALSDANYSVVISGQNSTVGASRGQAIWGISGISSYVLTASSFPVALEDRLGGAGGDTYYCGCVVYR